VERNQIDSLLAGCSGAGCCRLRSSSSPPDQSFCLNIKNFDNFDNTAMSHRKFEEPRSGSLAFLPKKRASSLKGKVKAFPKVSRARPLRKLQQARGDEG
jgi:hypothetical protein